MTENYDTIKEIDRLVKALAAARRRYISNHEVAFDYSELAQDSAGGEAMRKIETKLSEGGLLNEEEKAQCRVDWINDKYKTMPDALCSAQRAKTQAKCQACEQARVERIFQEAEEGMAGLDLDHLEYYKRQEFSVIPSKLWQALKEREVKKCQP